MVTRVKQAEPPVPGWATLLLVLLGCCWGLPVRHGGVDFCSSCHSSATCFQESGKSVCICNYGFIGNGRTYCNDKDECQIGASNICGNHSACHNTYGSFYCTCQEGFQPTNNNRNNTYIPNDGTYCKDIDECTISGLCGYGATCKNTHGSYECYCMEGYTTRNGYQPFRTDWNVTGSCTEVDCGIPLAVRNTFIDSKNKTTFGSSVTYRCQKGFVSDRDSSTFICSARGKWEGSSLVCTEIDCGRPPEIENSKMTVDNNTVFGSKVQYDCVDGFYSESGTNVSTCSEHGIWETPSLSCKAVDCGEPPLILKALAGPYNSTSYGSAIVYECQHGYTTEGGNTTAVCNAGGQWEGADLICKAVACGEPPLFPNALASQQSGTTYGSAIVYECENGYTLEGGNTTAVCNAQGQWEGAAPFCRAMDCGEPPSIPNASARPYSNTTYQSMVEYACHNGYIFESGNHTAECNSTGQWNGATIICRAVECGAPPSFPNASTGPYSNTTYRSVVVYECQNGYSAESGNHTAVCNGKGRWEGADPVCREIDCGAPPVIPHTKMIWNKTTNLGSVVDYKCLDGFHSVRNSSRSRCTAHRSWENITFSCLAIDCGRPPLIPHAQLIWDNSSGAGSVAMYVCEKGFRRANGRNVSHCTSNGSWEVPDVICKEIYCGIPKNIEHAELLWSGNRTVGSKAHFVCKNGFTKSGGKNYSVCTDEGVWEANTLTCTAEKIDIIGNLTLINETCLRWRKASGSAAWKLLYLVHVEGRRWHQKEFLHTISFNFTAERKSSTICLRLHPGTNYTVNVTAVSTEGSILWRTLTIPTIVKKSIFNATALNETCLQWRGADAEEMYLFHVWGSRWYQKDFFHKMVFNVTTDTRTPLVCLDLRPGTNYTVTITAMSSQSSVTLFMTTRIAVKKSIFNATALNETCLQWRGADAEEMYLFHVWGSRWYQKDFFHKMVFNVTTDARTPLVCLDLRPGTNYTVTITAMSSQSSVALFMTTRIADPPLPEFKFIEAQGLAPKLSFQRAEEKNGPISSYQILVVPFGNKHTFKCDTHVRSGFFSNVTTTEGYVTAEILSKDFVDNLEFSLGDRQYYGEFYNAPLRRGKDYCIILRITSQWNQERTQSCKALAQIKDTSPARQHVTVVGLGSLAVVCFFLFISFSAAWCCKRR
ncbi:sushi domain-containing protein 1 isoform X2 [Pleurodeles waltl]|uniref:sushi domain-containing protein 1 isoform X2 n=1 Tax=Pleurodeles waltl TaxID=8319 RepID=UPI0037097047